MGVLLLGVTDREHSIARSDAGVAALIESSPGGAVVVGGLLAVGGNSGFSAAEIPCMDRISNSSREPGEREREGER